MSTRRPSFGNQPRPRQPVRARLTSALLQVHRARFRLANHMLRAIGLVPPQDEILLYVEEHGPCPQAEIVRWLGRERATVTRTLQAMEQALLIDRRPSPNDRRVMLVELAEVGRATVPLVREIWSEIEGHMLQVVDRQVLDRVLQVLRRVKERLDWALWEEMTRQPDAPGRTEAEALEWLASIGLDQSPGHVDGD